LLTTPVTAAEQAAPWGTAAHSESGYEPQKVVYDVAVDSPERLERLLDRVSFLSNLYASNPFDAAIVLVLHGPEVQFFSVKNLPKHKALMERAQSLTVGGMISIRMCQVAAKSRGLEPKDIHGFVKLVPMGDAEIVRLQREGHAYMQ
jgi:intracellular sulfur oxidation DsrE/DsrF family protein